MAVILYGPSQVEANFPALMSCVFPTAFRSTRSLALNSLFFTSLLYLRESFYWYSTSHIVADSRYSSNKSSCFTINLLLSIRANSETRALHKFTLSNITAFIPYVRENKVSPVNLLGVVRYAHRMLGNSSAHLPLIPSNLLFNPFTIVLLVASVWPLFYEYAGVEYLLLMPRSLQNLWKALPSNCNPLSDTKDSGTPILVIMFLYTNFLTSTSRILANASASAHLVIMTIPALAPNALDTPSANTFHGWTSTWQTISTSFFGENSAMKPTRTWPFTKLLGLYLMSKEPSRVSHLAILPVKSYLFNNDYKGYSINK